MTEQTNSESNSNENPPAEQTQNPPVEQNQNPPANPPTQPQTERNHASNREVIAAVESLPEKIVNSLREAFTPPTPPASSNSAPANSDAGKSGESKTETPGKSSGSFSERFNKFWWGTK